MSSLEALFDGNECAEIAAVAADAHLSPEQFVRNVVLEVLQARRNDEMVGTLVQGEEPTMGLDELRNCCQEPF